MPPRRPPSTRQLTLLVTQEKHGLSRKVVLLVEKIVEDGDSLVHAGLVRAVDDKHERVRVLVVVLPVRADRLLACGYGGGG